MAKSLFVNGSPTTSVAQNENQTIYLPVVGRVFTNTPIEVNSQMPIREAGTLNNLFVYVSANGIDVNSTVITLRVSGVSSALTVSYLASQTGIKEDTSNTVAVADTDEVNYSIAIPNATGSPTIIIHTFSMQFNPTNSGKCYSLLGTWGGTGLAFSTASVTRYVAIEGRLNWLDDAEANNKYRIRTTITSSDLFAYVSANARTTDTIIKTRKNGADGGQSVTYSSTQTGVKEDSSGSDSLVVGDDFNYAMTTGTGTGDITVIVVCTAGITTNEKFIRMASVVNGQTVAFNVTTFHQVGGDLQFNTTEANSQLYPQFDLVASEMGIFCEANSIATSPTVITLRDNGSDSLLSVSYSAGQTGLKNDSVNTVQISAGADEMNFQVVTPNTSGNITINHMAILCNQPAQPTIGFNPNYLRPYVFGPGTAR